MKRLIDVVTSGLGLLLLLPVLVAVSLAIWISDRGAPLFVSVRCARGGAPFRMLKFRTMVTDAHLTGVSSTASTDSRITPVGRVLRLTKLDEVPQLWNVLMGDMSLVGPRPNIQRAVDTYSDAERGLLSVRPGITDFASIVFADEGAILAGNPDPDLAYEQLIRPGKSRLGLHYAEHHSPAADMRLVLLTLQNAWNRPAALRGVQRLLVRTGAPEDLVRLASRTDPLVPTPPPGYDRVVSALPPPDEEQRSGRKS